MLLTIDAKAGKIHTFLTVKKNLKGDFVNLENVVMSVWCETSKHMMLHKQTNSIPPKSTETLH